jgi:hypothetical protein
MILLGKIIVFLLGMCIAVQIVAAFYRIIDLWYAIGSEYPNVIKGILFWGGVSALMAFFLGENLRDAFLWGIFFYVPFYLVNFFLLQGIIKYRYQKEEQAIHGEHDEHQEGAL